MGGLMTGMTTGGVSFAAALVAFLVLDGLWLGVVMGGFYRSQMAPIARMDGSALAPIWPVAALVYVLLAAGTAGLVAPRASSVLAGAGWGACFGLVVYGVYDLTNLATLRDWTSALALVDIAWGTGACAAAGAWTVFVTEWWR